MAKNLRTNTTINKDSGTHFEKVVKEWRDKHRSNWKDASSRIEKLLRVSIDGFADFIAASEFDNLDEIAEVMGNLNKYVNEESNTWDKMKAEWRKLENVRIYEIDHHEFSRISLRLRVIYQGFVEMETELIAGNKDSLKKESGKIFMSQMFMQKEVSIQDISRAKEKVRELMMMAIAMNHPDLEANMKNTAFSNTYDAIIHTVQTWISETQQDQWDAIKEKQVDVINGKVAMDIKVTSRQYNSAIKGEAEKAVGGALYNVFKQTREDLLYYAKAHQTDFAKLEGSKAVGNEVVKQFADLATKGKAKPYKSSSNKRVNASRPGRKPKQAGKLNKIKQAKNKKLVPKLKLKPKINVEAKEPTDPQLRYRIQQGLRKRLQENMVRPNLIYRTGRFAKSVKLLTLTENEKGELYGKYTYQLNPYQTFEDSGEWPWGYNPKRVITQSIRELAEEKVKKRIAYLRRT